jgi:CheY-like chemotaxis protein
MNKKHILIVEDNPIATKIAKKLFEDLDCIVDCADDGDKAIDLASVNHYDGICMDIGLPTLNGIEACNSIRNYEVKNHLKPVPIIALTGNSAPNEIAEYLKAGMQEVLSKPFTEEKAKKFLSLCN